MNWVSRRAVLGSSLACFFGETACSRPALSGPVTSVKSRREAESQLVSPPEETSAPPPNEKDDASNVAPEVTTERESPELLVCEKVVTVVARNHGHELLVPESDVLAKEERTYHVRGTSSHDHRLIITAEEFAQVGKGEVLRKKTELGGAHRHRILVRCEPLNLPPELISVCEAVIAGEDGHEVVIPESHIRGGVDRQYDIQGVSGHTHVLAISANDFAQLLVGRQLDLTTGQGAAHFHHAYIKYVGPPRTSG